MSERVVADLRRAIEDFEHGTVSIEQLQQVVDRSANLLERPYKALIDELQEVEGQLELIRFAPGSRDQRTQVLEGIENLRRILATSGP